MIGHDLTQRAKFQIQLVSDNVRSVHQKKRFSLKDFDFDTAIRLRVFHLTDVVSIVITDEPDREFYVSLRLAELPLTFHNPFVYYI